MTISKAKAVLANKPIFGDDSQIRAERFLRRVDEEMPHFRSCRQCQNWEYCDIGICIPFDIQDALFEEFCPAEIKAAIQASHAPQTPSADGAKKSEVKP